MACTNGIDMRGGGGGDTQHLGDGGVTPFPGHEGIRFIQSSSRFGLAGKPTTLRLSFLFKSCGGLWRV